MEHFRRLAFCMLYLFTFIWQLSAQVKKIPQWERFEIVLQGTAKGNPFADASLTATFWQQGGDTVNVQGFYDGDGRYVIRFMPINPGVWYYSIDSNIASLAGKRGEIECIPAKADNHGPVKVRGLHDFEYADGTVYYPLGTTAYAWIHMSQAVQEKTLSSLKKAQFNKLRMCVFPKNYGLCKEEPEIYPFFVKGHSDGKPVFDFTCFNPAFFRRLEKRIDDLRYLGVEADLILFHPYDKGRWGFDAMSNEVNVRYIKYITARLASFRNVWWSMANEWDYVKAKTVDDWKLLTKTVVENDPYRHLCSIHGATATYFDYWMPEFTHVSIQDEAPVLSSTASATLRKIYRKPVICDEVGYEGNLPYRWGRLSPQQMTYFILNGLLGGIYVTHGECYQQGNEPIFWAQGGSLKGESWKRVKFLRTIIEAAPHPLEMADISRDLVTSTAGPDYYLVNMGKDVKGFWTFNLPVKNADYNKLQKNKRFKVEIIDVWAMTVTEYPVIFETTEELDYRVFDIHHRGVRIPDAPYIVLRITEVK